MKKLFLLFLFFTITVFAIADNGVKTSTESGRYEIIQGSISAVFTFKLDKYTGAVYQLESDENNDLSWRRMQVIGDLDEKINTNTINYQIYLSGLTMKNCFLINIHTYKYHLYNFTYFFIYYIWII